jgi:hypothetical protein
VQVPKWFVIGCSLVLLDFVLVLSTVVVRHATAGPPSNSTDEVVDKSSALPAVEQTTGSTAESPSPNPALSSTEAPSLTPMPEVPSIDSLPPAGTIPPTTSSILNLDDFKRVFPSDAAALSVDIQSPSQQLTQGFFEGLELRLESVGNLNEAAKGLIREASILFQRGEINEARNLLGKAAQLRELAAQLLVTR